MLLGIQGSVAYLAKEGVFWGTSHFGQVWKVVWGQGLELRVSIQLYHDIPSYEDIRDKSG